MEAKIFGVIPMTSWFSDKKASDSVLGIFKTGNVYSVSQTTPDEKDYTFSTPSPLMSLYGGFPQPAKPVATILTAPVQVQPRQNVVQWLLGMLRRIITAERQQNENPNAKPTEDLKKAKNVVIQLLQKLTKKPEEKPANNTVIIIGKPEDFKQWITDITA